MQDEILKQYNHLLSKGYLIELFPEMTGDWAKDKKDFTSQYTKNQEALNQDLIIDDDEDLYEFDD